MRYSLARFPAVLAAAAVLLFFNSCERQTPTAMPPPGQADHQKTEAHTHDGHDHDHAHDDEAGRATPPMIAPDQQGAIAPAPENTPPPILSSPADAAVTPERPPDEFPHSAPTPEGGPR